MFSIELNTFTFFFILYLIILLCILLPHEYIFIQTRLQAPWKQGPCILFIKSSVPILISIHPWICVKCNSGLDHMWLWPRMWCIAGGHWEWKVTQEPENILTKILLIFYHFQSFPLKSVCYTFLFPFTQDNFFYLHPRTWLLILEKAEGKEREGEKYQCEREISINCFLYMPQHGTKPTT